MKTNVTTALGIDVGESQISMVLLGKTKAGFRLLKAARVPLPDGAITGGRIVDEAALVKILRELKGALRARTRHIALALPTTSTVSRVIRLEEQDPQRIARYIRGEIREYAAFSGRETVSDFRVTAPVRHSAAGKVFLSAIDESAVTAVTQACRRAGLEAEIVEPAAVACTRVVEGLGQGCKPCDRRMVAIVKEGMVNLYAFRAGAADFIRTEKVEGATAGPGGLETQVATEINALISHYQNQNDGRAEAWSVTVVDDMEVPLSDDAIESLKANVTAESVSVWTGSTLSENTELDPKAGDDISMVALGLAMRFLVDDEHDCRVNLLPMAAAREKATRRNVLLVANAVALLTFFVIMIVGGLRFLTKQVNQDIVALRQDELKRRHRALPTVASELVDLEKKNALLTDELAELKRIADSHLDVQWVQLLDDMSRVTPTGVLCVTDLTVDGDSKLSLEGLSHSYEAVHDFAKMLTQSEHIQRAWVVDADRGMGRDELVRYVVACTLAPGKAI